MTTYETMLHLGDSYGPRRVCYIRKGHVDPSKLKCVINDLFEPGFLASPVTSFYNKTEIWIISKRSRSIHNIILAKF